MKEYRFIGSHAEELDGGRPIAPGDYTGPIEANADENPKNAALVEEGLLIEATAPEPDSDPQLTGSELQKAAAELDIKDRTKMSADELRAAVANAQAGLETDDDEEGED